MLKLTHDEARSILRSESEESREIIRLAEAAFADKLEGVAMN